jgi:hypothetical protein
MPDEGLAASLGATAANGLPWDQLRRVYVGQTKPQEMPTAPVDPNAGLAADLGRATVLPPIAPPTVNQPFGELRASPPPSPSERITSGVQQLLSAAGADNYTSNNLANKLMGLVQSTPLGVPIAAADTAHYNSQRDVGNTALAAAGMIPGAKPVARAAKKAVEEAAPIAEQLAKTISVPVLGPTSDVSLAKPYISNPQRIANPGVYQRPDAIAAEAAANVAPEHPALKALFGVTRDDLYGISQQGRRQGNVTPQLWAPGKASKPNEAAAAIMNPANAQRLIDTLTEAYKYPELVKGMVPWYVMDPAYQRMEKLVGPERAAKEYHDFNMTVSPFSAGSAVPVELNRGTAANMMRVRGEYPAFQQSGGMPPGKRPEDIRALLSGVQGHLMHKGPAAAVARYIETGEHGFDPNTVKIPLYAQASGVPQTGFQTTLPVPDTHFASAIGMPEARTSADFRGFMDGPEYRQVGPWFRESVAKPMNIEAVPGQALTWGVYSPQTGVRTPVGAGKLELLAQNIWERAQKLGVDPHWLRDQVLTGKGHASILATGGLGGLLGAAAMQPNQEQRQ